MMKRVLLFLLIVLSVPAFGRFHTRRIPTFRAFPPTVESLLQQNAVADRMHIARIQTKAELKELVRDGELVPLRNTDALRVAIPADRAFLRPWAAKALMDIAGDFHTVFGTPLQVNSAVRTVQYQRTLTRRNRNAAAPLGPRASVHPAGIAFDIRRRGMTPTQIHWLQWRLLVLNTQGLVIVEEELRQPCFHVVVAGSYPVAEPVTAIPAEITDDILR